MTDEPDATLTLALAEYEHLHAVRRAVSDESVARFNFFLVIASAGTAVSAGLVGAGATAGSGLSGVRAGAIAAIGALVLLLGVAVFARQVEYNRRSRRYAVADTTLRTYLVRRCPDLAPYVLMPTLDDPGPFAAEPFRRHWIRDAVGLAGTVGLMNSALLAVGAGVGLRLVAPWWVAVGAGGAVMLAAVAVHVGYVRRQLAASVAQVGDVLAERALTPRATGQPSRPPEVPPAR